MQTDDAFLTPDLLLRGYASGIFPMAESRQDPTVFWVDPTRRGVFPLHQFHISRSLARRLRGGQYNVTLNQNFIGVLDGCADRAETWISDKIRQLYIDLHIQGQAHSIEIWTENQLVGGVYGVTLGAAYFGESMFSRRTDASKIALAYLVEHLIRCGFTLFDTQFLTPHLASLGAIEIPRATYHRYLEGALRQSASFNARTMPPTVQEVLHRKTQTS